MDERIVDAPVREVVERLATSDPVPGGGSAAALAGATAAALVHMVVDLSTGRPAAADHESDLREIGVAASQFQSELLGLVDATPPPTRPWSRRGGFPRRTELEQETRRVQIAAALRDAIRTPLGIAGAASEVLTLTTRLSPDWQQERDQRCRGRGAPRGVRPSRRPAQRRHQPATCRGR